MSRNRMLSEATTAVAKGQAQPTGRVLALPDVLIKTAACLTVVIVAAVPGAIFLASSFILYLGILIVTMIVGVLMMRRAPVHPALALGYSALLGLIVGGFTSSAVAYGGNVAIIPQAVVGTAAGTIGMLALYATPFGRKASRSTRLFVGMLIGYFIIGVVSALSAIFFGAGSGWGIYGMGPFGLLLCLAGVALASWSLLIDIGQTDRALNMQVDASYDWTFGVSLAASIVWLYLEILRLLGIAGR
ncbi:MAG: Bax inhibitor-1/YccA family protein [Actinomycetes bacterium]